MLPCLKCQCWMGVDPIFCSWNRANTNGPLLLGVLAHGYTKARSVSWKEGESRRGTATAACGTATVDGCAGKHHHARRSRGGGSARPERRAEDSRSLQHQSRCRRHRHSAEGAGGGRTEGTRQDVGRGTTRLCLRRRGRPTRRQTLATAPH